MLILSRSVWAQRFLCVFNILIGLVIGWKSFNSWSLASGGWWKEAYFFAYFYGILLALIIICENIIIQTKHSWLVGLSLTMSMYGLFSIMLSLFMRMIFKSLLFPYALLPNSPK